MLQATFVDGGSLQPRLPLCEYQLLLSSTLNYSNVSVSNSLIDNKLAPNIFVLIILDSSLHGKN